MTDSHSWTSLADAMGEEIRTLRARLADVEAERDALASKAVRIFERSAEPDPLLDENRDLRARLAESAAHYYRAVGRAEAAEADARDLVWYKASVRELEARLAAVTAEASKPLPPNDRRPTEFLHGWSSAMSAVRAAVDGPAEDRHEFVPKDVPAFSMFCAVCDSSKGHPIHRAAVDPPADHIAIFDGPPATPHCRHYSPAHDDDLCCRCGVVTSLGDPTHCLGAGSPDHSGAGSTQDGDDDE